MVTVFVLEDDRDLNAVICRHLEMNGYHTVSCLSVQDAYDAMENTHYDAFISDIMMPGEDGFSFAREIRTRDADVPMDSPWRPRISTSPYLSKVSSIR